MGWWILLIASLVFSIGFIWWAQKENKRMEKEIKELTEGNNKIAEEIRDLLKQQSERKGS